MNQTDEEKITSCVIQVSSWSVFPWLFIQCLCCVFPLPSFFLITFINTFFGISVFIIWDKSVHLLLKSDFFFHHSTGKREDFCYNIRASDALWNDEDMKPHGIGKTNELKAKYLSCDFIWFQWCQGISSDVILFQELWWQKALGKWTLNWVDQNVEVI